MPPIATRTAMVPRLTVVAWSFIIAGHTSDAHGCAAHHTYAPKTDTTTHRLGDVPRGNYMDEELKTRLPMRRLQQDIAPGPRLATNAA